MIICLNSLSSTTLIGWFNSFNMSKSLCKYKWLWLYKWKILFLLLEQEISFIIESAQQSIGVNSKYALDILRGIYPIFRNASSLFK